MSGCHKGDKMDQDKYLIVINMLAGKIEDLQDELDVRSQTLSRFIDRVNELQREVFQLRTAKKRGPGRPKGSNNKTKAGLKTILKGGVRK
jgi:hypothetical protein